MYRWRSGTFILILVVGTSIAETVQNVQEYSTLPESERQKVKVQEYSTLPESERSNLQEDAGKSDYESALRPAVHHKRSIANIARLLLGGNVPPNHPLVKYPEPKAWNLASNILSASFPGQLTAAASTQPEGWGTGRQPGGALQNIQQLFETKAKIIPYTGQVATGLTGLASVKGDLIRQIHSISTQAIAQAAAEAAARALASAAAAHAVTNSIAHTVNPGAQTGIKGGWSSYQNAYAEPHGKTPGEQPGPPYQDSSAHINHYQAPPPSYNPYATQQNNPPAPYNPYQAQPQPTNPPAAYNPFASQPTNPPSSYGTNPYAIQPTTPPPAPPTLPTPAAYPQQNQPYQNNGYYTLYNSQPSAHSVQSQTPYTPAPPVPHARPTLSPSTLIATTPSGYSPSLSKPIDPAFSIRKSKTLPIIVYAPDSNNTPLTSFRRAVPVDIFGRNAAQPSSTSSLLSSISSLLSASTAAYNAAIAGSNNPNAAQQQQQQPSALFSTLLPSAHSPLPGSPTIHRPSYAAPAPSVLSSGISSSAYGNGYQQQSANPIPQSNGNYGRYSGGNSPGNFQHQAGHSYPTEARSSSVNPPSYPVNQHVSGHSGANYAQPGGNAYAPQSVQHSPPQFSNGFTGNSVAAANTNNGGRASGPSYSTTGAGFNQQQQHGSGNTGYNGGPGSSPGHVGGWNTQYAGSSPSASTWPTSSPNVYPPGYAGSSSGNFNNPSGGFGGTPTGQFPIASGSSPAQQAYPTLQTNAYQPSAPNSYAQAQAYPQQPTQLNNYPVGYQSPSSNSNGFGGIRNSHMTNRYDSHDLNQSASTMGNDYDDDNNSQNYDDDEDTDENTPQQSQHHSYQAQRRSRPGRPNNSYSSSSSSRYPGPGKKRPGPPPKRRPNNHSYSSSSSSSSGNSANKYSENNRNHQRNKHGNSVRKDVRDNGKPFLPTGNKKGSQFDSSAVDVVDASVDDYYYEGDRYESDELRNHNTDTDNNKNRWRTKNPSGQRPNSIQNHNSNGRWSGKTTHANQAPPKNVRGYGEGPEKSRPKPGPPKGGPHKDHRNKKVPPPHDREQEKKHHQQQKGAPKTEAAQLYRGRIRPEPQPQQQQPQPTAQTKYKSRDIYTTLPEYVFRVGERPDVFLRPGGKRKQGIFFKGRGFLRPRVGETNGSGGGSILSSSSTQAEAIANPPSNGNVNPYDEAFPRETPAEEDLEKSADSSRTIIDTSARAGEEEEFISASEAVDETARDDVITLSDQVASSTGFITSEEFDPEEREAFVEDVYADDHQSHHSQRRQDYDEDRVESPESLNEDNYANDDWVGKK